MTNDCDLVIDQVIKTEVVGENLCVGPKHCFPDGQKDFGGTNFFALISGWATSKRTVTVCSNPIDCEPKGGFIPHLEGNDGVNF